MKNHKENLFFENFLVWKKGPEVPTSAVDPLEKAKAQYFKLREYLRSNYKALDGYISEEIAQNRDNEHDLKAKKMLDQVAFDEEFDPNNISEENLRLVAKNAISGYLEFVCFHTRELYDLGNSIADSLSDPLAEPEWGFSMEKSGVVTTLNIAIMGTPEIVSAYDEKTKTTRIRMTDPATEKVIYEKSHGHPFLNKSPNLGPVARTEPGSFMKVGDITYNIMSTPAVEEVYDPETNTTTLKFSSPAGGKPFWTKELKAVKAEEE